MQLFLRLADFRRRRGPTPRREVALGLALAVMAVALTACLQVKGATCMDFGYSDGLDTRYTATRCGEAVGAAGYPRQVLHNRTAADALLNGATDAIFFFAGHSLVSRPKVGTGGYGALGLYLETPDAATDDVLLGDSAAAPYVSGPSTVCNESGSSCRSTTLVPYAFSDHMEKYNLVVLQTCNSAHAALPFTQMTLRSYASGAGTTIGFSGAVSFATAPDTNLYGDAWARRFWSDAAAGYSYRTAVANATAAVGYGYGYQTYVINQQITAPTGLRPAKYFPGV